MSSRQRKVPLLSCTELKTDIFFALVSLAAIGEVLCAEASYKLSQAVEVLYVPSFHVFHHVLVPLTYARDSGKTLLFQFERNSSRVVQCVPSETDRLIVL